MFFSFVFFIMLFANFPAVAELRVDVYGGKVDPLPIAVADFGGENAALSKMGADIAKVIEDDLASSGLFRPITKAAFINRTDSIEKSPTFKDWQAIKAQGLILGRVIAESGGKVKAEFRLWDVFSQVEMEKQAFSTTSDNWRRVAHMIADLIYKRLTGEDGYFDTRIIYIAESGPKSARKKRLAIMDQDGVNNMFLTGEETLVLTPRFAPNMQRIVYMSYYRDTPRVYTFDLITGRQEVLGDFPGMTFAPRFSPDGKKIIFSMARGGRTNILEMNLANQMATQLTDNPDIDTSPSYSPDGKKITFSSDRSGTQQIYVMNADGSGVKRISRGRGSYATPVWSPRGDYIAFTKIEGGVFKIGVMLEGGEGERILDEDYMIEGPTWSPNGRVLMYYRQTPLGGGRDRVRLYSVDVTGYNKREVITPTDASDPAWSPLLSK